MRLHEVVIVQPHFQKLSYGRLSNIINLLQ